MVVSPYGIDVETPEPLGDALDVGVVFDKVLGEVKSLQLRKALVGGTQEVSQHYRHVELQAVVTSNLHLNQCKKEEKKLKVGIMW